MPTLDEDLATFYDRDAAARAQRDVDPQRVAHREEFATLLQREGRTTVLEVGTGPGRDAAALIAAGFQVSGVDLSAEHVRMARQVGVDAHRASVLAMPFPARRFDAGWTMSTLMHVPDAQVGEALAAIADRLVDGAPLAVGLWGGVDREGVSERDAAPRRFFSLRSHERARAMLADIGRVERFETWERAGGGDWQYQWAIVRIVHG